MINTARRRNRTIPEDTRTRILDTAERLFAERGIDAVSLRSILAKAGVNVALAHYHFGSREGLIEELLRTRVAPLMEDMLRAIDEVDRRGAHATLEDVLRAYFTPAASWLTQRPRFGRIYAQLYSSPNPEVQALGRDSMRKVLYRLAEAVAKRMPSHLDRRRFFFRFYLAISGPAFLSGNWEAVCESARKRLGPDGVLDAEALVEEFVAFAAAGLRARTKPGKRRKA